jgi:glycosyltransferase involved in cell wall biosynthesis
MEQEYPLVSAIMLAGKIAPANIMAGIECFKSQDYSYKELIIVNNAQNQLDASSLNIKAEKDIFIVDTPQHLTTGMARNYGISAANGQILAQFDADYWHSPSRLSAQVAGMAKNESHIAVFNKTLSYSYVSDYASYHTNPKEIILETMVFIRPKEIDYPNIEKNEELGILNKLNNIDYKTISINNPVLCCKLFFTDHTTVATIEKGSKSKLNITKNPAMSKEHYEITKSMLDNRESLFK